MVENWQLWKEMLIKKIGRPLRWDENIAYNENKNTICVLVDLAKILPDSTIYLDKLEIQTTLF